MKKCKCIKEVKCAHYTFKKDKEYTYEINDDGHYLVNGDFTMVIGFATIGEFDRYFENEEALTDEETLNFL
jgi:hypothetical protein